jgi:hypothetical protein
MEIPKNSIIADGPEGLTRVLNELLEKAKSDPIFAGEEHFILYQLNAQKSLIKVDAKQVPFNFWHYDLMGRPATTVVKDTIARFLWEKCGERERYLQDVNNKR